MLSKAHTQLVVNASVDLHVVRLGQLCISGASRHAQSGCSRPLCPSLGNMSRIDQWHKSLISYGLVPYLITAVWFMNRVGDRNELLDWPYLQGLFRAVSPFYWASLGIYVSITASVCGAAWCALPLSTLKPVATLGFRPRTNARSASTCA